MNGTASVTLSNPYAIFDMDGTLIDSNHLLDGVSANYLAKRSLPPNDEFNKRAKVMRLFEYCELLRSIAGDTAPLEDTIEEVKAYAAQIYEGGIREKPYVQEFLEKLKKRGVRMCIASATEEKLVDSVLSRLGLRQYFEFIITVTHVGKNKADPTIFAEAAKRFGEEDHSSITVYEDAFEAMNTAKSAGFRVIGVYDDAGKEQIAEEKAVCDLFIDSFGQLITLLNNMLC